MRHPFQTRRFNSKAAAKTWARSIEYEMHRGQFVHDLRRESTSRLFEKGLNIIEVATITAHMELRMLRRYTYLKAEDLVKKLGLTVAGCVKPASKALDKRWKK